MNACPQIARCALRQWHGLTEDERLQLNAHWNAPNLPASVGLLHGQHVTQVERPLWSVTYPETAYTMILVSIKTDFLGDVLEAKP